MPLPPIAGVSFLLHLAIALIGYTASQTRKGLSAVKRFLKKDKKLLKCKNV